MAGADPPRPPPFVPPVVFTQSAPRNPLAAYDAALLASQAGAGGGGGATSAVSLPPPLPALDGSPAAAQPAARDWGAAPPPPPPPPSTAEWQATAAVAPPPPPPPPPPTNPVRLSGATPGLLPASLAAVLRGYQLEGVSFLWRAYAGSAADGARSAQPGAVLADDMGLGKSLQTIAFLAAAMGKTGDWDADVKPSRRPAGPLDTTAPAGAPALIVAPTSTLPGWRAELDSWCGFAVAVAAKTADAEGACAAARGGRVDVVLSSYDVVKRRADFAAADWGVLVVDEAHRLKSAKAGVTAALGAVGRRARFRLALTGTPVANHLAELYAIVSFAVPGALAPDAATFRARIVKPIEAGSGAGASAKARAAADAAAARLARDQAGIVLRRSKESVAADALPTKRELVVFCPLGSEQRKAYNRILDSPECRAISGARCWLCRSRERAADCCAKVAPAAIGGTLWPAYHSCDCGHAACTRGGGGGGAPPSACKTCPACCGFPLLSTLRAVCNHLEIVRDDVAEALARRGATDTMQGVHRVKGALAARALALGHDDAAAVAHTPAVARWADVQANSGKLFALVRLLKGWAAPPPGDCTNAGAGAKPNQVLVFSSSVRLLSAVEDAVRMLGYRYVRLDGSVPAADRRALIDSFNRDSSIFVFLLSTGAGGEGLNLQSANRVVIIDPEWSPAKDAQAVDRAFRLGQSRDVHVYRLIAAGTIEECIYARQLVKAALADTAVPTVGAGAVDARGERGAVESSGVAAHPFSGIRGDPTQKGELWGYTNLLRARADADGGDGGGDAGVETAARLREGARLRAAGAVPRVDTAGLEALETEGANAVDVWAMYGAGGGAGDRGARRRAAAKKRPALAPAALDPDADAAGSAALLAAMPPEEAAAVAGARGVVIDHAAARRGAGPRDRRRAADAIDADRGDVVRAERGPRGKRNRLDDAGEDTLAAARATLAAATDAAPPQRPTAPPPPAGAAALAGLADMLGVPPAQAAHDVLEDGAAGRDALVARFWTWLAARHGVTREDVVAAVAAE